MKYTEDQYNEEVVNIKIGIKMFQQAKDDFYNNWLRQLFKQKEYKHILKKLAEYETELKEFQKEHYNDFRVFTNTERYLSTRLDRSIVCRGATLK